MRLLKLYQRRLQSNLLYALKPISQTPQLHAEMIAAMIDGLYLRSALSKSIGADAARDMVLLSCGTLLKV